MAFQGAIWMRAFAVVRAYLPKGCLVGWGRYPTATVQLSALERTHQVVRRTALGGV